jgi:hypothetical protein
VLSIVGAVILAAVLFAGCLGGDGGNGETWIPTAGDFVEYETATGEIQITTRIEIRDVTSTNMTMNTTTTMPGYPPFYSETTVPINQTFGFEIDINNPPEGWLVDSLGTDNISTNWGNKTANHYQVSLSDEYGSWSGDIYVFKGVLLKMVVVHAESTLTMTLVDTNLEEITNQ